MTDRKVKVQLDASTARRSIGELGADLDRFEGKLGALVARVKVDQAVRDLGGLTSEIKATDLEVELDLDLSELQTGQELLDALGSSTQTPKIDPDTSGLDAARTAFERAFAENPTPKIDPDTSALDAAVNVIADLDSATIRSKFQPETRQLDKLLVDVKALERDVDLGVVVDDNELNSVVRRVAELTGSTIDPKMLIDDGNLNEVARQLEGLSDRVTVNVDTEDSAVDRALRKIDSIDSETAVVDVDVAIDESEIDGIGNKIGGLITDGVPDGMSLDGIKGKLGALAKAGGGMGLIGAGAGLLLIAGITKTISQNTASLYASLRGGFDDQEMAAVGSAAGDAYRAGFGESLGQIKEEVALIEQVLGDVDVDLDLDSAIQQASALSQVFDVDLQGAVLGVRDLIATDLVADTEGAFDLMFAAAQKLGPDFEEALEIVREFADDFQRVGFTGSEAFGLIASAAETKLFPSIDRAGDIFQEFGIRLGAGDIIEQVEGLGLSFEDLQTKIADGRGAEALAEVATALREVEDDGLRTQLAMEIFGTAVEEASSPDAVLAWLEQATAIEGVEGAATDAATALREDLGTQLSAIPRKVEGALLDALVWVKSEFVPGFLESFSGVIEGVSEVFTALKESVIENFGPVLDSIAQVLTEEVIPRFLEFKEAVTEVFQGINESINETFGGEGGFLGFITETVIPALADFAEFIYTEVFPVLLDLYLIYLTTLLEVLGEVVSVFIEDVLPALIDFAGFVKDEVFPVLADLAAIFVDEVLPVLVEVAEFVGETLVEAWQLLSDLWTETIQPAIEDLGTAFNDLWELAKEAWEGISEAVNTAWELVEQILLDLGEALTPITEGWEDLQTGAEDAWEAIGSAIESAWEIIEPIFTALLGALSGGEDEGEGLTQANSDLAESISEAWESISTTISEAWEIIEPIFNLLVTLILEDLIQAWEDLGEAVELAWEIILLAIELAAETISGIMTDLGEGLTLFSEGLAITQESAETAWTAISTAVETSAENQKAAWQGLVDFLQNDLNNAWTEAQTKSEEVWTAIDLAVSAAKEAIVGYLTELATEITGPFSAAFDAAKSKAEEVWPAVSASVSTAKDLIVGYLGDLASEITGPYSSAMDTARSKAEEVWPAVSAAVSAAKDLIVSAIEAASTAIGGLGEAFSAARSVIEGAIGGAADFVIGKAGAISDAVAGIISAINSIPLVPDINIPTPGGDSGTGGLTSTSEPGSGSSTPVIPAGASAWGGVHDTPYLTWVGEAMLGKEAIVPEYASLDHIYGLLGQTNILGRIQQDMTQRLQPGTVGASHAGAGVVNNNNSPVSMTVTIEDRGSSMAAKKLQARELADAVRRGLGPDGGLW